MSSITDRLIRDTHARLTRDYAGAGQGEILDHLAWEVGGAASELVGPARWVGAALVATGICDNPSEAHARVARLVAWQARAEHDPAVGPDGPVLGRDELATDVVERRLGTVREEAVARMEEDIAEVALPIHARLESCPASELAQAAETMLNLALEHGDAAIVEDVVVSLLIFSGDWGDGRWWDRPPRDDVDPPARPRTSLHDA